MKTGRDFHGSEGRVNKREERERERVIPQSTAVRRWDKLKYLQYKHMQLRYLF